MWCRRGGGGQCGAGGGGCSVIGSAVCSVPCSVQCSAMCGAVCSVGGVACGMVAVLQGVGSCSAVPPRTGQRAVGSRQYTAAPQGEGGSGHPPPPRPQLRLSGYEAMSRGRKAVGESVGADRNQPPIRTKKNWGRTPPPPPGPTPPSDPPHPPLRPPPHPPLRPPPSSPQNPPILPSDPPLLPSDPPILPSDPPPSSPQTPPPSSPQTPPPPPLRPPPSSPQTPPHPPLRPPPSSPQTPPHPPLRPPPSSPQTPPPSSPQTPPPHPPLRPPPLSSVSLTEVPGSKLTVTQRVPPPPPPSPSASPPPRCPPPPGTSGECFSVAFDYAGNDLFTVSAVETVQECQFHCKGNGGCKFFTYDISAKNCYLKTSDAGRKRTTAQQHISGPKACPGRRTPPPPGATDVLCVGPGTTQRPLSGALYRGVLGNGRPSPLVPRGGRRFEIQTPPKISSLSFSNLSFWGNVVAPKAPKMYFGLMIPTAPPPPSPWLGLCLKGRGGHRGSPGAVAERSRGV